MSDGCILHLRLRRQPDYLSVYNNHVLVRIIDIRCCKSLTETRFFSSVHGSDRL